MSKPPSAPLDFLERRRGVLAVLVVAVGIRLDDLSAWWLNPDEGIYYSILTRGDFNGFWHDVTANAHPPLYYLLLRGMGLFTHDLVWFRLLSRSCWTARLSRPRSASDSLHDEPAAGPLGLRRPRTRRGHGGPALGRLYSTSYLIRPRTSVDPATPADPSTSGASCRA